MVVDGEKKIRFWVIFSVINLLLIMMCHIIKKMTNHQFVVHKSKKWTKIE